MQSCFHAEAVFPRCFKTFTNFRNLEIDLSFYNFPLVFISNNIIQ